MDDPALGKVVLDGMPKVPGTEKPYDLKLPSPASPAPTAVEPNPPATGSTPASPPVSPPAPAPTPAGAPREGE